MPSFDATEALDKGDEVIIDEKGNMHEADSPQARNANGTKMKGTRWS